MHFRKHNSKCSNAVFAGNGYLAFVQLGYFFHQCKADAVAFRAVGFVSLVKLIEYLAQLLFGYFAAVVCNGNCQSICLLPDRYINNSSLVMRMQMGNYSVMWLGDAQKQAAEQILSIYAPENLKADIMQVAHHGYTGGSDALYRAIAAEIILWPVPEFRYDEMLTLPVNSYCKETDKVRATFISGIDDDTLDMTAPIEARQYFHHGTIRTDLTTGKMLPLNWCCLTGGSTGYTPAKLVYPEEGGCRLIGKDARTLVQMVKNGQTAISDKYTFRICGTYDEQTIVPEDTDPATLERLFGLEWNYPKHMVWDDTQVFPLPAEIGKPFAYTLSVDKTANKATLYDGDTLIKEWDEVNPASCGIHIIMKNISLTLTEVVYEG